MVARRHARGDVALGYTASSEGDLREGGGSRVLLRARIVILEHSHDARRTGDADDVFAISANDHAWLCAIELLVGDKATCFDDIFEDQQVRLVVTGAGHDRHAAILILGLQLAFVRDEQDPQTIDRLLRSGSGGLQQDEGYVRFFARSVKEFCCT